MEEWEVMKLVEKINLAREYQEFVDMKIAPHVRAIIEAAQEWAVELGEVYDASPDMVIRWFYEIIMDVSSGLLRSAREGVIEAIKELGGGHDGSN